MAMTSFHWFKQNTSNSTIRRFVCTIPLPLLHLRDWPFSLHPSGKEGSSYLCKTVKIYSPPPPPLEEDAERVTEVSNMVGRHGRISVACLLLLPSFGFYDFRNNSSNSWC
ncbi:hypothetical protein CEXT_588521 [Caerostris extrusa]|uniref:Uncharacterized protein n=1 Tax=Caerostris extrusa TaxID=172846 RepID=A0AAV4UBD6_CAEEX|nr:hypothetical protein CEXT_588521 [Caerostris extrusa]